MSVGKSGRLNPFSQHIFTVIGRQQFWKSKASEVKNYHHYNIIENYTVEKFTLEKNISQTDFHNYFHLGRERQG